MISYAESPIASPLSESMSPDTKKCHKRLSGMYEKLVMDDALHSLIQKIGRNKGNTGRLVSETVKNYQKLPGAAKKVVNRDKLNYRLKIYKRSKVQTTSMVNISTRNKQNKGNEESMLSSQSTISSITSTSKLKEGNEESQATSISSLTDSSDFKDTIPQETFRNFGTWGRPKGNMNMNR